MKDKNKPSTMEWTICPCGYTSPNQDDFIWIKLKDNMVLLCFSCSDIIHQKHIAKGGE